MGSSIALREQNQSSQKLFVNYSQGTTATHLSWVLEWHWSYLLSTHLFMELKEWFIELCLLLPSFCSFSLPYVCELSSIPPEGLVQARFNQWEYSYSPQITLDDLAKLQLYITSNGAKPKIISTKLLVCSRRSNTVAEALGFQHHNSFYWKYFAN